jgi:hypothetical protein
MPTSFAALGAARRRRTGGYDVRSLFSNGEVGGWWDPSDTTTLFQDSAGTTPVTTLGQPVGLVIDKSKGGLNALGPNVVPNGDFSAGSAGWTLGAGWLISGGVASFSNPSGAVMQRTDLPSMPAGRLYRLDFDLTSVGTGVVVGLNVGGGIDNFGTFSGNGRRTAYVTTTTARSGIAITGIGGTTATLDNISVREVPGNHLVQTTDTARPRWDARSNLLTQTENLAVGPWTSVVGTTRTAAAGVAPDGTTTATLVDDTSASAFARAVQAITVVSGASYTFSVYLKADTSPLASVGFGGASMPTTTGHFQLSGAGTTAFDNTVTAPTGIAIESVGDGWYRCRVTQVASASGAAEVIVYPAVRTTITNGSLSGVPIGAVYVWGAQLEYGPTATPYQRVTTATDYADIGLPRYLSFDGLDDFLRTAVGADINFTSTDEMTVCCGVRKLSDAAAVIAELSANVNTNNGAFVLSAGDSAGRLWAIGSRGTVIDAVGASNPAPDLAVITGRSDISAPSLELRRNGVIGLNGATPAISTATQGTGNYGTYPLFIGRRAGTSNPFNGRLNQLVIRNRLTADGDLANLERFVAAKTGVTLP